MRMRMRESESETENKREMTEKNLHRLYCTVNQKMLFNDQLYGKPNSLEIVETESQLIANYNFHIEAYYSLTWTGRTYFVIVQD